MPELFGRSWVGLSMLPQVHLLYLQWAVAALASLLQPLQPLLASHALLPLLLHVLVE